MSTEARDAEFIEKQTWIFTTPRAGRRSADDPIQGERKLVASLSASAGDELEQELKRYPGRSGRLRIYRDGREVVPPALDGYDGLEEPPDDEPASVLLPTGTSPLEVTQLALAEKKAELARLEQRIVAANREASDAEAKRERVIRETNKSIDDARNHAERMWERAREMDRASAEFMIGAQEQLVRSMTAVKATRDQADSLLQRDSWGNLVKEVGELGHKALESPIGQIVGLKFSGMLSAALRKSFDGDPNAPELDQRDALRAMVITGAKHREARSAVQSMARLRPKNPAAQGATAALAFIEHELEISALAKLFDEYEGCGGGA